jgi:hypothetical protein
LLREGDLSFTNYQLQPLHPLFAAGLHSLEIPHSFITTPGFVFPTPITFNPFNFIFNFIPIVITTFKMKFSIVAASLVALAAAHNLPAPEETCSASVTVTVTHYASAPPQHTPSAPASLAVTDPAPYPTGPAAPIGGDNTPLPSVAPSSGVAPPAGPIGGEQTPLPSVVVSGTAAPTGTGSYSAPPTEFTGAASGLKAGSALAGIGAVAALFF